MVLKKFLRFLDLSPTAWHAARQITDSLAEADFTPLFESECWDLEPGKSYFVLRDESVVCAFRMPKEEWKSSSLLATHLDSPALKLKPLPELLQDRSTRLMTEVYGSPLLHTWLDRDLCLSGRAIVKQKNGEIESHLVHLDDYPLSIPSLPLHLDRSSADKGLIVNRQDHLQPIAALQTPYKVASLISKVLSFSELLSWDLFLVPLEKARFTGAAGELISSYRLDNLSSAFAALYALLETSSCKNSLQLAIFWDHEEIGSKSALGAESFFVNQVLDRIRLSQKKTREELYCINSRSSSLSIDAAHGFNPNFPERFDPRNTPYLGDGVVLKMSALQKYATSASSSARLIALANKNGWNLQKYASRSDIQGGSTVGPAMAANTGIMTCDIGIAAWAMHSIREQVAASDEAALCQLSKAFLQEEELFAFSNRPF